MKNKFKRSICIEEYVPINGINQFLFHMGTNYDNPVMLYLSGGPGNAESIATNAFHQEKWEEIYTVVHWDQRGAGKTFTKNPDKLPTFDLMMQDLYEVVQYLKKKYNRQKIVLLGHSWGSVLGTMYVKKYPEDILYYIGVSQVVSMLDGERAGYNKVREMIERSGDKKSMKKLQAIGEYPGDRIIFDNVFLKKIQKVRKLQEKYKMALKMDSSIFLAIMKSPIAEFSDIIAFMNIYKANKGVYGYLGDFNLWSQSEEYKVPIYYILGGCDWQVPYVIAQDYFKKIIAPNKNIYVIPNAGHFSMMDQPEFFFDALSDINKTEKKNQ